MSRIDELISHYCPEGVIFEELGKIATVQRGASPRPIQQFITNDENGVPWIKIGDTKTGSKYVTKSAQKITLEGAKKSRVLKKGDFIISNSMSYGRPYILGIDGAIHDGWAAISNYENYLNSDFLYHYLTSKIVQDYWDSKINSGSVSNLNADIIKSLKTPIPPLPVQEEIVKILDKFTQLEAELEAELEARTRQYEYYRNQFLAFEGKEVEWRTLGEVGDVKMCKRIFKNETKSQGDIPFYKIGTFGKEPNAFITKELFEEYKSKFSYPKQGDVLISASGTIGRTVIYEGEPAYFQDSNIVWIANDEKIILNKFLFHYYKIIKWQVDTGGVISRLYNDNIKKAKIPVPSLEEQERFVKILDQFDALVNDISVGLPAEIKARREQYEYYRGKLLTFQSLVNS